ncbi:PLD nuclease N-terminal domain-containing protein [Lactiplantibacillus dongliensis]|uniref:PLD nuclease N-terminal domain-containing protein n=1 Tax=Lactiplantibacillus dongliensis TaxID=2559919 RepID=A0ABW1R3H9_9LACO|nr:PLD nuclease N-terminal domain-containing protein [Lactiplantibacillus dongliensis]
MATHCRFQHHAKLSRRVRQRIAPFAAFEFTATSIAIADILRAKSVRRGHKLGWLLLTFVQPIGPWLYFAFGQTRD